MNTENNNISSDQIRLNKYISDSGYCSRRKADLLISSGKVTVNGKTVAELGFKISSNDKVSISGQLLLPSKHQYIILNKPKNTITTTDDPEGRKTVLDYVSLKDTRIYPVGRLDRNTTGLILLTNDGNLTNKLLHPSFEIEKTYKVKLNSALSLEHKKQLLSGVDLEDGVAHIDRIKLISSLYNIYHLVIHSGKNRVVRRLFESLSYEVKSLERIAFAGLNLEGLSYGNWRHLTKTEISALKSL